MRLLVSCLLITLLAIAGFSCSKKKDVPASRTFYMGTTSWPADFTVNDIDSAYDFINTHCDIISHHFDEGVPYEEAFYNKPMPDVLVQDVATRKTKTASSTKIFLSVSALGLDRITRAGYYQNAPVKDSVKNFWSQLNFDDTRIVTAYVNYISWLIEQLHPIYVNFGVESNSLAWNTGSFVLYKQFIEQVYQQLKIKYSTTPFFVSFMVDESSEGYKNAGELLPYTDFIGLSAYPYVTVSSSVNGNTDPKNFPAGYFERFSNLDSKKPLVIAETGYIAQSLSVAAYNLNKQGTATWQKDYLEKILRFCDDKKAKMLIWFCNKDYDAANTRLKSLGLYQDLFALWQDTGFKDEHGAQRPAYNSWLQWMQKIKTE